MYGDSVPRLPHATPRHVMWEFSGFSLAVRLTGQVSTILLNSPIVADKLRDSIRKLISNDSSVSGSPVDESMRQEMVSYASFAIKQRR
jgi:hypothetical protein